MDGSPNPAPANKKGRLSPPTPKTSLDTKFHTLPQAVFLGNSEESRFIEAQIPRFWADKTRILPFGRHSRVRESFDFLGFTFLNGKTRNGKYRVVVKTSAKKLKAKRQAVKEWMWHRLTSPVGETLVTLNRKLIGHYNYYGVNGNYQAVHSFWWYVKGRLFWTLRRRSQKHRMTIVKFQKLWDKYIRVPYLPVQIWGCA